MKDIFIAKYEDKGIDKTLFFEHSKFTKKQASKYLNEKGIQNFFFSFDPEPPTSFGENGIMCKGIVGFDITSEILIPYITDGKDILLDTPGGDLFEGWKIHDLIKLTNKNPKITVVGTCASAGVQILLATENRYITKNSRILIHNPTNMVAGDDSDMLDAAKYLTTEKLRLAKEYSEVSGKQENEILDIMKQERYMDSVESINMNFAKKVNENEILTNNEKNKDMEITKEDKTELTGIKNLIEKLMNRLNPPKNLILQDVNGVEIDFGSDVETVEQISVGSTATVDGSNANGEYVMQDGTVYVFEDGTLTEIREPENKDTSQELENLKMENNRLKNKIDGLEKENKKQTESNKNILNELNNVKTKFDEFQNKFSDDTAKDVVPENKKDENKKKVSFKIKY